MKPDFETYLQQAREDFCKVAYKYNITDHLELRTEVDSLLIAYDQAVEALRKHSVSGKQLTYCQCKVPTGRTVTADFENQICDSCGRLVASADTKRRKNG